MPQILYINPIGAAFSDKPLQEYLDQEKAAQTKLTVQSFTRGPHHLEYHYYETLILADIIHRVRRAEKEGFDAVVIGCFYDPGLWEAREITQKIIITAPAESSMHIASTLGHRFSIIVGRKKWIPVMHTNVKKYGFQENLASFKSIEMGVLDFHRDPEETKKRLINAAQEAVEIDLAEVIILGCTAQFGFFHELQLILGVPVIDSAIAALKYAEFLVELSQRCQWSHSKKYCYESPPLEEIKQWKIAQQYHLGDLWSE